jgi:uncharacterized membrane protein
MTNTKIKTQTQPQPFSAEQRKGIVQLLADTRKRVEKGLESVYELNNRIEAELLPKLAKERGAASQVEKVQRLRKECKEAETALAKLGFDCDERADCLSLAEDAPKELRLALDKALASADKERDAELLKYDKAILKVWAAQDAPEMMGIVEGLI